VTEPPADRPDSVERPAAEPGPRREPFLFRLVRTAIAPPVLQDGGADVPMSRRGRIVFWTTVTLLVIGITVLLVASARR
jgi:hypothetical protein